MVGLKIHYSITNHLEDFGITSVELKPELQAKIGEFSPVFVFVRARNPRRCQSGTGGGGEEA